jgi:hypothetical protein
MPDRGWGLKIERSQEAVDSCPKFESPVSELGHRISSRLLRSDSRLRGGPRPSPPCPRRNAAGDEPWRGAGFLRPEGDALGEAEAEAGCVNETALKETSPSWIKVRNPRHPAMARGRGRSKRT